MYFDRGMCDWICQRIRELNLPTNFHQTSNFNSSSSILNFNLANFLMLILNTLFSMNDNDGSKFISFRIMCNVKAETYLKRSHILIHMPFCVTIVHLQCFQLLFSLSFQNKASSLPLYVHIRQNSPKYFLTALLRQLMYILNLST